MTQALVTILTAPKPFIDSHIKVIQMNALRSWKALGSTVDVVVLGNDPGIKEAAHSLGMLHYPDVICNKKGTPLISSMLEIGRNASQSPFLAIVNADIILFPDFTQALMDVSRMKDKFLIIGQRWDMDVIEEIGNGKSDFAHFKKRVSTHAKLHPPTGSDYFIFSRTCYQEIPDFAIGRAGWDNWFIYKSRWEGWAVIDGTHAITAVHQTHDYAHLPGGLPHYRLPETTENVIMGGGEHTIFTLFDAQYDLVKSNLIKKKRSLRKIFREIEIFPLCKKRSQFFGKLLYYFSHPQKGYALLRGSIKKLTD